MPLTLAPIARVDCPICGAPWQRREHLRGGELCTVCGFAIRLGESGELLEWWTTNQTHPRGATWAAVLLVLVLGTGCGARATALAGEPPRLLFDESRPDELQICVLRSPFVASKYPVVCISLGDLRAQLRGRQTIASSMHGSLR